MSFVRRFLALTTSAVVLAAVPAGGAAAEPIGTVNQLTAFDPPTTSTYCSSTSIDYNSSSAKTLVGWIAPDPGGPTNGVAQVALMDNAGLLASTPVDVSVTYPTDSFNNCEPVSIDAGANGGWLVTWDDDTTIFGAIIDSGGNPVGSDFVISSNTNYGDIETVTAAWSDSESRYLVTWKANVATAFVGEANSQEIAGRFIDASGAGIGNDFLVTNTADGINNSQDVAFGAGIWISVGATNSNRRAVGQIVTTAGPQGSVFNLSSGVNQTIAPSIAYNSATAQFLAVFNYSGNAELARLLNSVGTPVGSDIELWAGSGSRPRVAPAGQYGYLATWHSPGGNLGEIYGVQLNAAAEVTSTYVMSDGGENWRPETTYSAAGGVYLTSWWGNPGTPNESNVYSRAWYVNTVTYDRSQAPPDILQQVGATADAECLASPAELNWSGVDSDGWSKSWAEWAVPVTGGWVCTRWLTYDVYKAGWTVMR